MKVQDMERKLRRRSLLLVLSAIHFLGVSNFYLQLLDIITKLNKMTFAKSVFFTLNIEAYVFRVCLVTEYTLLLSKCSALLF